jgi:heme exporter protein A
MRNVTLEVKNVAKIFYRKILFEKISFVVKEGQSFAITGKNGSGKSTLIKILCGLLSASKGIVSYSVDNTNIHSDELYMCIGLVSPYLNMYDEFTGEENLQLFMKIRGLKVDETTISELLKEFNIYEHRKKELRYYSSGMKQRLKYCAAVIHQPAVLFLDEPTANLDEQGILVIKKVMERQKKIGSLVFATNETNDLKHADSIINLDQLNNG